MPVTRQDKEQIDRLIDATPALAAGQAGNYAHLPANFGKFYAFEHSLGKRSDGRCQFLTPENRCSLHEVAGAQAKPSMCRLFPYTFTDTSSGYFASLSFASTGVLFNSGAALNSQEILLREHLQLFLELFPDLHLDWSCIQMLDGLALGWSDYLTVEHKLLHLLEANRYDVLAALLSGSRLLARELPDGAGSQSLPPVEAPPEVIDSLLLAHLSCLYFPDDVFASRVVDLQCQSLMRKLVNPPEEILISGRSGQFGIAMLSRHKLGRLDDQSEDLLFRFLYCRVFGKLFFGPGFGNLSLIAGWHHLATLVALIRLQLKMITATEKQLDFQTVCEVLRAAERQLSRLELSRQSQTILEVLLSSGERVERMFNLCA